MSFAFLSRKTEKFYSKRGRKMWNDEMQKSADVLVEALGYLHHYASQAARDSEVRGKFIKRKSFFQFTLKSLERASETAECWCDQLAKLAAEVQSGLESDEHGGVVTIGGKVEKLIATEIPNAMDALQRLCEISVKSLSAFNSNYADGYQWPRKWRDAIKKNAAKIDELKSIIVDEWGAFCSLTRELLNTGGVQQEDDSDSDDEESCLTQYPREEDVDVDDGFEV